MYRDCYAETSGRNILGEILPASLITDFPFSNSFFFLFFSPVQYKTFESGWQWCSVCQVCMLANH